MRTFLPKMLDLEALDEAIASDDIPWVPQEPGRWFKPLHFFTSTGTWINLVKMEPGKQIRRHVHAGGSVHAYVLEGSWRYLEHDWIAAPGSYVFEPAGGAHTLEVLGSTAMVTLFIVNGVIQYLDAEGGVDQQDDLRSRRQLYLDYCREQGVEPVALVS
ncbi:MAG: 2,4'-dihydroxyacetophenone dioxygenase family protein [Gaiellaceae bacterium]